jgi:hypothetical protein
MTLGGLNREETLKLLAMEFDNQMYRHARAKIIKEIQNRGYTTHEIVVAVRERRDSRRVRA